MGILIKLVMLCSPRSIHDNWYPNIYILEGKVTLSEDDEAEEDPVYQQYKGNIGFITTDHVKDTFKASTNLEYIFICLTFRSHIKYQFI